MAYVRCPYCLTSQNILSVHDYKCPECNNTVPESYVNNYKDNQPIWLVMAGFSQHGKTTYLAALILLFQDLAKAWHGTFPKYLNEESQETVKEIRKGAKDGVNRPKTDPEGSTPHPLLIKVNKIPNFDSKLLVLYDIAGEHYDLMGTIHKKVPYIKQVNTIWFFVSPPDLEADTQGRSLTDLFESYQEGMKNLNVNLNDRNLLIIYTKADKYFSDLPESISEYLANDEYKHLSKRIMTRNDFDEFDLDEYSSKMKFISDELKEFTYSYMPDGGTFINMVEDSGLHMEFAITSALGNGADDSGRLLVKDTERLRVLDPFLWSLLLNKTETSKSFLLIYEFGNDKEIITDIWKQLSNFGKTNVFYFGNSHPINQPNEIVPAQTVRPMLLCPIVEKYTDYSKVIIFTKRNVIDLHDLYTKSHEKILFVTFDDVVPNWSNVYFSNGQDALEIVEFVISKLKETENAT